MLFDQPATLEPEEIHNWYLFCVEALDQQRARAQQAITGGQSSPDIWPLGTSQSEINIYIENAKKEIALTALLLLTGSAEARIRLDGQRRAAADTDQLAAHLRQLRQNAQKPWQVPLYENGIMDAWKLFLQTTLEPGVQREQLAGAIGNFKILLDVRHWLAHGRYWELKRSLVDFPPALVVKFLRGLYSALNRISADGGITPFR